MRKHPGMYFTKTGDVKSPCKAHATDAGFDFFVPNDSEPIFVTPGGKAVINLKIKVSIWTGYALIFKDKSGVALKKNLLVCGGVVDSGYTGEIILQLHNYGNKQVEIQPGEKIAQAILLPISIGEAYEWSNEEYNKMTEKAERGDAGHGSTGSF